jgi:hypothetical protein
MQNPLIIEEGGSTMHSILDLAKKPTIVSQFVMTTTADVFHGIVWPMMTLAPETTIRMTGYVRNSSYMNMICRMFRYWRGAIKLFFTFHSSPLVTFRIALRLIYAGGNTALTDVQDPDLGDGYTEVVTVRGSATYSLSVPYVNSKPWLPTFFEEGATSGEWSIHDTIFPQLRMAIIDKTKGMGSVTPSVFVTMTIGADDDFMVRCPIAYCPQYEQVIIPEVEEQCDLNAEFLVPFQNPFGKRFVADAYAYGPDRVIMLEELLRRYEFLAISIFNESLDFQPQGATVNTWNTNKTFSNFEWIMNIFKFWSGSIRLKGTCARTTSPELPFYDNQSLIIKMYNPYPLETGPEVESPVTTDGASIIVPSVWKNFDVEVPYYNSWPVSPITTYASMAQFFSSPPGIVITPRGGTEANITWYRAAGPDFQVYYVMPTLLQIHWPEYGFATP